MSNPSPAAPGDEHVQSESTDASIEEPTAVEESTTEEGRMTTVEVDELAPATCNVANAMVSVGRR